MAEKASVSKSTKSVPQKENTSEILFGKENFKWLLIGLAVIFSGFYLMSGGGSENPNEFNEELFSTTRIVIAPLIVIAGFIIEVYAILKKN